MTRSGTQTRRAVQLAGGSVLIGVGIVLLARAGLGLDPYRMLLDGAAQTTGLPFGTANAAAGLLLLALSWWPGGVRPGVGTAVQPLVIGATVHELLPAVGPLAPGLSAVAAAAAGLLLLGTGAGVYLGAGLGASPYDEVPAAVRLRRPELPFGAVYTLVLAATVAAGLALGGAAGPATLAAPLLLGPLTAKVRRACKVPRPAGVAGPGL